jgi:chitodextrinase
VNELKLRLLGLMLPLKNLALALSVVSCGGGGGGGESVVYKSFIPCWNGVTLTSSVSQAAADELLIQNCTALDSNTSRALQINATPEIKSDSVSVFLSLAGVPTTLAIYPSTLTAKDTSGKTYTIAISQLGSLVQSSPGLPFGETISITNGWLDFYNAPSLDMRSRTFDTPQVPAPLISAISLVTLPPFKVGNPIMFSGSGSTSSSSTIARYDWSFGDGGTDSGINVMHRFVDAKSYQITLTVTDSLGRKASSNSVVNVTAFSPPVANLLVLPQGINAPVARLPVGFGASGSDADGVITAYVIDFGDGFVASGGRETTVFTHKYAQGGTYTVKLTVTDDSGLSSSTQIQLVLSP